MKKGAGLGIGIGLGIGEFALDEKNRGPVSMGETFVSPPASYPARDEETEQKPNEYIPPSLLSTEKPSAWLGFLVSER